MIMPNYDYWEKALANPAALKAREFRVTSDPQPGFYRNRHGRAVAIWYNQDGVLTVSVDGLEMHPDEHETIWLNCAMRPVTEEWWRIVDEGGVWPDLDATVAGIGDNRRGSDIEGLIEELAAQAHGYEPPTSDEEAARAISLRAAILEQHKRADTERTAAKAPHLKAAQEVDALWMPMVKVAKQAADRLRALVEGWETAKRMAARMAEEARIAQLGDTPVCVPPSPAPSDQIRSGYGRAASVRSRMVVTGIADIDAVTRHYIHDARLIGFLIELAQRDVDAGQTVPGVTASEHAVIR